MLAKNASKTASVVPVREEVVAPCGKEVEVSRRLERAAAGVVASRAEAHAPCLKRRWERTVDA